MAELADELVAFLASKLELDDASPAAFRRHVEGFSWETYEVGVRGSRDGAAVEAEFIVHRVPGAGLLEPYDPRPVFELRRAVERVEGVPVPATLSLDERGV